MALDVGAVCPSGDDDDGGGDDDEVGVALRACNGADAAAAAAGFCSS